MFTTLLRLYRTRQMRKALEGYPRVDFPFPGIGLTRRQAEANRDFFAARREQRAQLALNFIKEHPFGVPVNDSDIVAIWKWIFENSGLILLAYPKCRDIFVVCNQTKPWIGDLRGCNLIFDLALLLASALLRAHPNITWCLGKDRDPNYVNGYIYTVALSGLPLGLTGQEPLDVLGWTYGKIRGSGDRLMNPRIRILRIGGRIQNFDQLFGTRGANQ